MTAPLDSTSTESVEVAQAPARTGGQTGQQIVARIPPDCVRTDVQVQVDIANRYMLPQVPNVGALRKMVQGDNIVVSTQGLGALVLDDFVTAARSGNPPFVVLADGTVLTAQQVLRLPERQIAVDQCQPQQQAADQTAADLAQTAPGAGPGTTPGAGGLPQIAPGAGPGGGGGGDAGGSRFQSEFSPSPFDLLNYNPVQPLAFGRSAPELAPGSNLINDQAPIIPEEPEEVPPGPNDTIVNIGPASGTEDFGTAADQATAQALASVPTGPIPLPINVSTVDPNETITVTITLGPGVNPASVQINGQAPGPNGWTFPQSAVAAGLSITQLSPDSDRDIPLNVTVTTVQNNPDGSQTTFTSGPTPLNVVVDAVADDPIVTLTGGPAAGLEDTPIALPDISTTLQDTDGSETVESRLITNIPPGAQILLNGAPLPIVNGQVDVTGLTPADLNNLQVLPPQDFAGNFTLNLVTTVFDAPQDQDITLANNRVSVTTPIPVTVAPVADTTFNPAPAAVREDTGAAPDQAQNAVPPAGAPPNGAVALDFGITLAPNETLRDVVVSGVPAGAVLQIGGVPLPAAASYTLTPAQIAQGVSLVPPVDADANFSLTITPTVSQAGQDFTLPSAPLAVTVDAVADDPLFTLAGADPAGNAAVTTPEDTAAALPDAATLGLQDASETLSLTIDLSGAPAGTTLVPPAGATLTPVAGQPGVFQLSGATPAALLANYNGLQLQPPADFSGTIPVVVRVTSTETAPDAGDIAADNTATVAHNITVTVTPVRDSTLTVAPTSIKEDLGTAPNQTPIPAPPSGAQPVTVTLTVGPNETVTDITISGVPAGVTFNQGTNNNNGTWSFTQAQLTGLTINALPQNSDSEFTLTVTAGISQNGVALPPLTGSILVTVDAVADAPILTLSSNTATGAEDTAIALPDITSGLRDTDGSETFGLTLNGVPAGAVVGINGVALDPARNLGGGQWNLAGLTQAQLNGLTLTPPANFSGAIALSVTATATEGATGAGEIQTADNVATTTQNITLSVTPVRDSTLTVAPTSIKEDLGTAANQTPIPAPPSGAQPVNITLTVGPNETVTSITVSGVPTGVTFNQGTNNNNGTWSFTQAQLTGLTINGLPQNSDSEFTLTVTAGISQNGVALPALTGNVVVTVDAVADAPVLTLSSNTATGAEDTAIALPDITSNLRDADGSETLALTLTGVPAGAVVGINGVALDPARNLGGGQWNLAGLTQAQLDALTLTPPANFTGTIALNVVATATEGATGAGEIQTADNVATTTQNITLSVTPVRDSTLTVAPTSIKEDLGTAANQTPIPAPPNGPQPMNVTLTVGPNETVTDITISGVPAGVTFNQGTNNNNGTWSFTQAQLTGLTINGLPQNSDSEFTLTVTAGISQNGVALPALTGNVVVTVDAVADAPVLTLTSNTATGNENTAIALPDITSNLRDTDGSETLSLVMNISGAPAGSVLSINGVALDASRNLGGGQWNLAGLTQAQLNGLTITPPNEFGGSFQLTVTATATEGATGAGEIQTADNVATVSQNIAITVNALPNGGQASATVSEAGNEATANFNAGSNAASNVEIATGSLNYSFDSDGQAAANPFTWGGTVTPTDGETGTPLSLTSGGVGVVWGVSADGLTITGTKGAGGPVVAILQVTDVATGAFRYEQIGPFDHPDAGQSAAQDPINLSFNYTVRDANGDSATGNLNVTVQDDAPVAAPIVKTASEQFGLNTNLLITLDVSGSMNDPSGVTGLTRLQAAKLAIAELIEQYDALGDVAVRFVTFSSGAASNGGGWLTVDQAMAFLDGLTAGGSTNYDAALNTAQTAFGTAGKIAGAQNTAYFFSDGVPNQPVGSEGINAAEQATWETFLRDNDIKSYAIGIGTGVTTGPLEPIGYDGVVEANLPAISVTDLSQLPAVLSGTIPPATVTGSILSDPGPIGQFGADNGRVNSITINGTTYTYNPATDSIVVTGGPNAGTFDAATNVLTVNTTLGGKMVLDFDDGTYVYTLPTSIAGNQSEIFQYTLIDNDGDLSNSSTVTFNLIDVNRVPVISNDTVITNIAGSGAAIPAPAWALLANDVDPDNDPLTVTGVSGAVDGTVAFAGNVSTFTDNDTDGGTYNYTGSDGTLTNNGHVIVNRAQANEATLDGTGFGEILIGRTSNDTILANDGNDVLIGGGGTDVLNAGAGNDIMLFQGLSSTYLGGTGTDTLRIEDVVGGTLDLRAAATDDARIENIDKLALANSNPLTVQLDYQGLLDLEADGNSLRITAGPNGAALDLSEPVAASGTNVWVKTVDTATVDTYTYTPTGGGPVATLVVDNQVNVV